MSIEHTAFEALILRLPDGDLTREEASSLQEHLNSCADCRRLFRAVQSVTRELDTLSSPPVSLSDGVMERIHTAETAKYAGSTKGTGHRDLDRRAQNQRKRRRRGFGAFAAIAAVVVLVVGGGFFAAQKLFHAGSDSAPKVQSVSLEAAITEEAPAAAEPAAGANGMFTAVQEAEPMEAAAEAEDTAQDAADSGAGRTYGSYPSYTLDNPAHVQEGREADFEAILQDVGWPDGVPETSFQAIAYVEYRGVIYEFFSDPDEEYLLWRDAAEGVNLIHTPAAAGTLFGLIG